VITLRNNITITKHLDLPYTNMACHHHQNPLCQTAPPHSEQVVAKRENSVTSLQVRTKRTPITTTLLEKAEKENRKSPSTTLSTEHHDPPPTATQPTGRPTNRGSLNHTKRTQTREQIAKPEDIVTGRNKKRERRNSRWNTIRKAKETA